MSELSNSSGRSDGVEETLKQVCELIESAVTLHRSIPPQPSPMVLATDGTAVGQAVGPLLAGAKYSVSVIVPGALERARPMLALMGRFAAAAKSGVTVRLLCTPQVLAVPHGILAAVRGGQLGFEVRITDADLHGTVIVDGKAAFGRSGPERDGRYATVNTDLASVRALYLMFAGAWGSAMPVHEHLRLADRLRSDSMRVILERLREGHTDDVAAKKIQISLRTYRRHVAAIMRDVGASSRFQAGVRAVELGLLSHSGSELVD
ncbi:helix-turn-helix transcriptional regulator [Streptomyces malaysiensis]|uniref:helix-turn-helix transcriptional regulator n=1 Tax=Streptomyces malaysiensis TaxID=92644 RepID=UPI000CA3CA11|nr:MULTISPECIES: response regulator transcription factor [unclassified Streptomyces]AUA12992.1 hypothetical protein CFP59_05146 [Streptomyces sp. M56]MYX56515.1 hypothetical protein [Streptomyces sp. SID8382]